MRPQEMAWKDCDITQHGLSWKQLFFERYIAQRMETFGLDEGISEDYEISQIRPPIDATHPDWAELYPAAPLTRRDERPTKERFCKFGLDCDALRLARSPNCGWPALERLKLHAPMASDHYVDTFAWAQLEQHERLGVEPVQESTDDSGDEEEKDAAAAAGAAGPAKPAGKKAEPEVPTPLDPEDMLQRMGLAPALPEISDAAEQAQRVEDAREAECDAGVMKEFLTPLQLQIFSATGELPEEHQPCVLCRRALQLSWLVRHFEAGQDVVFSLNIGQCLAHLDMEVMFAKLPNLTSLQLTYGVKQVGMRYDRALLGMKVFDAMGIAKCLKATSTLTSLALPCNVIDDDLLRLLVTGLLHNQTVTHLDLSHNKITEQGVRYLAKALSEDSVIMSLDLSDNHIGPDGGIYLSRAIQDGVSLMELHLRLNLLGDDGIMAIAEAAMVSESLTLLDLANNGLHAGGGSMWAPVLQRSDCPLEMLSLAGNKLANTDVELLANAVTRNNTLSALDLRRNDGVDMGSSAIAAIKAVIHRNELARKQLIHGEL